MQQKDDILEALVALGEIAKGQKNGIMVYESLFLDAAKEISSLRIQNKELNKKVLNLQGIEY